jgi:hypothetical protein
MNDEVAIAELLGRSFAEKRESWTPVAGPDLQVRGSLGDGATVLVQEFGTQLSAPARRYAITFGAERLEIGPESPARDVLAAAMESWRDEARAATMAGLKDSLAAHLAGEAA